MRVLAFGTYDAVRHPRIGVLIAGLRDRGVTVDEAVRPLRLDTAARVKMLQQPWRLPLLAMELLRSWFSVVTRGRWSAWRSHPDAVLVGYLGHFDVVLARLTFPRTRIVLDHLIFAGDTARDRGVAGLRAKLLDGLDALALACADLVVVDTEEHAGLVPARVRRRTVVCPVGAGSEWFEAGRRAPSPRPDGPLRVIFFGLFTPLQGAVVIAEAANLLEDRPDVEITMVGTGQDHARAREIAGDNARVTWHDWTDPRDLPGMVAAHDVSLGIFGSGPKSRRVVPTKVYQGSAAGCVVVTSDTSPQRRALGSAGVFVTAGRADELAAALVGIADDRAALAELRERSSRHARAGFTPRAVTTDLCRALSAAPQSAPRPSVPPPEEMCT